MDRTRNHDLVFHSLGELLKSLHALRGPSISYERRELIWLSLPTTEFVSWQATRRVSASTIHRRIRLRHGVGDNQLLKSR
jgi:hypothetical protein